MRRINAIHLMWVTVMAIFLSACEKETVETTEIVRPVRVMTISGLLGGETLSYPGEIQGMQNVELGFEVAGRLVELPVEEGADVNEDQLLARLDPADFQAALDSARAQHRSAKDTYERFAEVFERGAISRQEYDNARRQYDVEKAQLATAEKAVSDTYLRAPFNGRIGRTHVDNFTNVQAKQPIVLLQDLTRLEIVVNIPEQDWLRAKPGLSLAQQTARARPRVSLSTLVDREFPAEVVEISAAADPVTRTFAATARFDPPTDVRILPGMSANLTISVPEDFEGLSDTLRIPANAVVGGDDGNSYVWKVDASTMKVTLAPVTVGQLSGTEINIIDGLVVGDRIAVSGVQHLSDGMKIRELTK